LNEGIESMRSFRVLTRILLALTVVAGAGAEPAKTFMPAQAGLWVDALPAPPADGTPAGLADLETLLQVQADRTAAQVARARRVEKHTAFLMGAAVFGDWFTPENLPMTARFFKSAGVGFHPVLVHAKEKWMRPRPYLRDARVHPCLAAPGGTSYPSGHSASAAIWAELFSEAFPEHREDFAAQVRETMWSRVLAGVHYPSDTQAGRMLGESIGRAMATVPATQHALGEVRREIGVYQQMHPANARVQPVEISKP
jgi:acid phosphatase (class A)